jgi:hypothetical protein
MPARNVENMLALMSLCVEGGGKDVKRVIVVRMSRGHEQACRRFGPTWQCGARRALDAVAVGTRVACAVVARRSTRMAAVQVWVRV